ncbi:DUF4391 domain-containing protein [uncultured Cetobacterium sp.]|uniref:DUF4391 domain-containing protein n=1 Tax=uncultured Cetobacterium sp. TaxID=527638 RepID=UPI0025CE27A9|nr:DUF4391 domain-containing protein [uncultured Cetobacterium sp.]
MEIFNFPKELKIDKIVPKEIIYRVADADEKLKRIFVENVERIRLQYILNYKNTNIESYIDSKERYEEINFLKVELKEKGKENTVSKLLHQLIPKATVVILGFENEILISLAKKEITENTFKVEELQNSLWINNDDEYLKELIYKNFNSTNLKLFYESIIEKIKIYNLSKTLKIDSNIDTRNIEKLEALNKEIEELKALRKKETQLNKIAEIQTKLVAKMKEKKEFK